VKAGPPAKHRVNELTHLNSDVIWT